MDKGKMKFYYFPLNARGGTIRAILSAMNANWENSVVSFENWPTLKNGNLCEFKQLPVLEHGTKKLVQKMAIELYLAKLYGIYGKNSEDEYQINSLLCTFEDLLSAIYGVAFPKDEEEKKNADQILAAFITKYTFYFQQIEKRYLARGKKKYYLGDYFSLADIFITVMIMSFYNIVKEKCPIKTAAPGIFALIKRIADNELKSYFAKYFVKNAC